MGSELETLRENVAKRVSSEQTLLAEKTSMAEMLDELSRGVTEKDLTGSLGGGPLDRGPLETIHCGFSNCFTSPLGCNSVQVAPGVRDNPLCIVF